MDIKQFQEIVWEYYQDFGRDLPWREPEPDGRFDAYKVMVSEIMLQQTQAVRVIPKYEQFLSLFPRIEVLANASLAEVLKTWSGLGYNRRAKFLWQAAGQVSEKYNGVLPTTQTELTSLPGIGVNTAGAICAYAFNLPVVFIETNIRTVFIHHFFADRTDVTDKEIESLVKQSMDTDNPREWYWALMDYGVFIKSTVGNTARDSKHYTKQSVFHGSKRQTRGQVIKLLTESPLSTEDLRERINDKRLTSVLQDLEAEGLVKLHDQTYSL